MHRLLLAILLMLSMGATLSLTACDKLGSGTPKPTAEPPPAASAPP
ncbi:hypothetical protein [Rhizobacter sp. OV335]|nr:hypothetical protein [Rhizobacter sp. OV335]SHN26870.1 hypothetical protein SAMN02787076_04624 [Rhizobacter sp. OV335]